MSDASALFAPGDRVAVSGRAAVFAGAEAVVSRAYGSVVEFVGGGHAHPSKLVLVESVAAQALRVAGEQARLHLDIATLETRRSDSLDFHEVAVWSLRSALVAAFEAGRATALPESGE